MRTGDHDKQTEKITERGGKRQRESYCAGGREMKEVSERKRLGEQSVDV